MELHIHSPSTASSPLSYPEMSTAMLANPVLPGFYPDPSVCRVGDDYYLATSSFEYFPGVPLFHSRDLIRWTQIGHCLTRTSQLDLRGRRSSDGIFAPTLRYHDGNFYMITTDVGGAGHFYVTTRDPRGEWSDPVFVQGPGFDPDLFFDVDGTAYFTREDISGYGIRQYRIDISTGELLSDEALIWEGFEDRLCEAPHIYRIGAWYYLLVAEGGTHRGHMVVIARSTSPSGPYDSCPHNPILTHRHRVLHPVQAVGHGDLVEKSDGSWWMVFLGIRPSGKWHTCGRETFIAPVEWVDGWPVVNGNRPIEVVEPSGPLANDYRALHSSTSFFRDGRLSPEWNVRGWFEDTYMSEDVDAGTIQLRANQNGLQEPLGNAFLGRRQQHHSFRFEVSADVSGLVDGSRAGVCALMNEKHHYACSIEARDGSKSAVVTYQIGSLRHRECVTLPTVECPIWTLYIEGSATHYVFGVVSGGADVELARAETRYLSSEVAGGFTGVYLGIFAEADSPQAARSGVAVFSMPRYAQIKDEVSCQRGQWSARQH